MRKQDYFFLFLLISFLFLISLFNPALCMPHEDLNEMTVEQLKDLIHRLRIDLLGRNLELIAEKEHSELLKQIAMYRDSSCWTNGVNMIYTFNETYDESSRNKVELIHEILCGRFPKSTIPDLRETDEFTFPRYHRSCSWWSTQYNTLPNGCIFLGIVTAGLGILLSVLAR